MTLSRLHAMAKNPTPNFHEDLSRAEVRAVGSDRGFAIVFCVFFTVLGGYQAWKGSAYWPWWLASAAAILAIGLTVPRVLGPFNFVWTRFGLLLGRLLNPLVLGAMFYLVITPVALVMRALGKQTVPLRPDRAIKTYWIRREPPGPKADSMINQF